MSVDWGVPCCCTWIGVRESWVDAAVPGSAIQEEVDLYMAPSFGGEGVFAGKFAEMLKVTRHVMQVMPLVGLRFSMLQVIPAKPYNKSTDSGPFEAEGCMIPRDGNFEVLKSPIGSDDICVSYCLKFMEKQKRALEFLASWVIA